MAIKDARCNVPACPFCAEKDAEIDRLQNIIIDQINSLRRHAATVGDRYSDEAMALQRLLRGEG